MKVLELKDLELAPLENEDDDLTFLLPGGVPSPFGVFDCYISTPQGVEPDNLMVAKLNAFVLFASHNWRLVGELAVASCEKWIRQCSSIGVPQPLNAQNLLQAADRSLCVHAGCTDDIYGVGENEHSNALILLTHDYRGRDFDAMLFDSGTITSVNGEEWRLKDGMPHFA